LAHEQLSNADASRGKSGGFFEKRHFCAILTQKYKHRIKIPAVNLFCFVHPRNIWPAGHWLKITNRGAGRGKEKANDRQTDGKMRKPFTVNDLVE